MPAWMMGVSAFRMALILRPSQWKQQPLLGVAEACAEGSVSIGTELCLAEYVKIAAEILQLALPPEWPEPGDNVPLPLTMPQACSPVAAADSVCAKRLGGCLQQGSNGGHHRIMPPLLLWCGSGRASEFMPIR